MSGRGTVTGLPVAMPVVEQLPGIYREDLFLQQFTSGLDDVLAPAVGVLDCIDAYVAPSVAPPDFLEWLAAWVGVPREHDWGLPERRRQVADAVAASSVRGTVGGLAAEVELYAGGRVTIQEPGGTWCSPVPTHGTADRRGSTDPALVRVVVEVPPGVDVSEVGLHALVRAATPAHLPVEIEVRRLAVAGPPADERAAASAEEATS